MTQIKIDLLGEKELISKLKRLDNRTGAKIIKEILRKGGHKIKKSVKEEAPEVTGNLKKSIKVFNDRSYASKNGALIRVGADVKIAPHAHLVEFGTEERELKKPTIIRLATGEVFTLKNTGKMPANNFFERGYEKSKDVAIRTFEEEIKRVVKSI